MSVDLRLAIPALGAWLVAIVLIAVPDAAVWVAAAAWIFAAVLARRFAVAALVLVAIALLASSVAAHEPARTPSHLVEASVSGRYVEGTFVATEAPLDGRVAGTLNGGSPVLLFGEAGAAISSGDATNLLSIVIVTR